MKLYYSKGSCSLAIRILINELNLKVDFVAVNLKNKQTEQGQDFFKINIKGAVPSLQLEDGSILTENLVIQQYLADTHNGSALLPKVGEMQRYRVLEWSNFVTTELHKGCGPFFNPDMPADVKEKKSLNRCWSKSSTGLSKPWENINLSPGSNTALPISISGSCYPGCLISALSIRTGRMWRNTSRNSANVRPFINHSWMKSWFKLRSYPRSVADLAGVAALWPGLRLRQSDPVGPAA